MKIEIRVVVKYIAKIVLMLAVCFIIWLVGNIFGIRYQQSMIKFPTSTGIASFYDLHGEQERTLDNLKEGQAIVCTFLFEHGAVEVWIENESGEQMTAIESFDHDGSFLFSVPYDGDYTMKIMGQNTSLYISSTTYEK